MNEIARPILIDFWKRHPDAEGPLKAWWTICKKSNFSSFAKLKETFGSADIVEKCVVFNIGGNKYRLVARVNFETQRMWIKYVLTHSEYDRLNLEEDEKWLP